MVQKGVFIPPFLLRSNWQKWTSFLYNLIY
nr:MAG TPA: hypothetical protein [Microviridae sp.]